MCEAPTETTTNKLFNSTVSFVLRVIKDGDEEATQIRKKYKFLAPASVDHYVHWVISSLVGHMKNHLFTANDFDPAKIFDSDHHQTDIAGTLCVLDTILQDVSSIQQFLSPAYDEAQGHRTGADVAANSDGDDEEEGDDDDWEEDEDDEEQREAAAQKVLDRTKGRCLKQTKLFSLIPIRKEQACFVPISTTTLKAWHNSPSVFKPLWVGSRDPVDDTGEDPADDDSKWALWELYFNIPKHLKRAPNKENIRLFDHAVATDGVTINLRCIRKRRDHEVSVNLISYLL
jgi:hypothetical protein